MNTTRIRLSAFVICMMLSEVSLSAAGNSPASDISSFGFGAGLSLTLDTGKNDRIKRASVVNGLVRVEEDKNNVPRFVFETHYFFTPKSDFGLLNKDKNQWGYGPFVCIEPGDNIINAIGAGFMLGFKRNSEAGRNVAVNAFNVGVGVIVDQSVQVLGDGLRPNQALPPGETAVRFKTTSQTGVVFIFSVGF